MRRDDVVAWPPVVNMIPLVIQYYSFGFQMIAR
jgi:hypothetical protein